MSASGRLRATCLGIIAMAMMACTSEPEATPDAERHGDTSTLSWPGHARPNNRLDSP